LLKCIHIGYNKLDGNKVAVVVDDDDDDSKTADDNEMVCDCELADDDDDGRTVDDIITDDNGTNTTVDEVMVVPSFIDVESAHGKIYIFVYGMQKANDRYCSQKL